MERFLRERDEIVDERGAELSGAIWSDFERWSGGANTHVSGERKFSPLSSAHMLCTPAIFLSGITNDVSCDRSSQEPQTKGSCRNQKREIPLFPLLILEQKPDFKQIAIKKTGESQSFSL